MSKYHSDCYDSMKSIMNIFPIEVDLPANIIDYSNKVNQLRHRESEDYDDDENEDYENDDSNEFHDFSSAEPTGDKSTRDKSHKDENLIDISN